MKATPGSLHNIGELDRRDFDLLWLLAAAWEQDGLKPTAPTGRALVIGEAPSPDHSLALEVAASVVGLALVHAPSTDAEQIDRYAPLAERAVCWDPEGRIHADRFRLPVVSLLAPGHDPVAVVAHLYRSSMAGHSLRGLRVLWDGEPGPALGSWIASTRSLPVSVTQVGGEAMITEEELGRLRDEGQAGEFRRISRRPAQFDVDAREDLDPVTRALATAALLRRPAR